MRYQLLAFDFEWHQDGQLYCAAFIDDRGHSEVYHLSEFKSESQFLYQINCKIISIPRSMGWWTTGDNSDLAKLHARCQKIGVKSIVRLHAPTPDRRGGLAEIYLKGLTHEHIDLCMVFQKMMIRTYVFDNAYKSYSLDEVAKALLGYGKLAQSEDAEHMSIEEVKRYCLHDAKLVMELAYVRDGKVLDLIDALHQLLDMKFIKVAHSGVSTYWARIYEKMNPRPSLPAGYKFIKRDYQGGICEDPLPGVYENLFIVDVTSLYPTMALNHNLSFDTVNCPCCKNDPQARVPPEVYHKPYWICRRKRGAFPTKLDQYKRMRLHYKRIGDKIRSDGLKLVINGGYGVFGHEWFKFAHMETAELIPAYGRFVFRRMQEFARMLKFTIVGGDTDSLFMTGPIENMSEFIHLCKANLSIDVEHQRTLSKAVFTAKKHYFGIDTKDNIIIKGYEGKKDDRPKFIRDVFAQFIEDYCRGRDYLGNLRESYLDMISGKVDLKRLSYSIKLTKDRQDYRNDCMAYKLAQMADAKKGDVLHYYKCHDGFKIKIDSFNELDFEEYKDTFESTFKDILHQLGFDIVDLLGLEIPKAVKIDQTQTLIDSFYGPELA